jgi:hypothetical protein
MISKFLYIKINILFSPRVDSPRRQVTPRQTLSRETARQAAAATIGETRVSPRDLLNVSFTIFILLCKKSNTVTKMHQPIIPTTYNPGRYFISRVYGTCLFKKCGF